ncbi:hypothetical protein ABW20_dc0104760 [Dactylellina cionopaga]|nr:hypothetical protein ABW20_dc0104760 [Dactylellina cionopaga]
MKSLLFIAAFILANVLPVTAIIPWKDSKARARFDSMHNYRQQDFHEFSTKRTSQSQNDPPWPKTPGWVQVPLDHFNASSPTLWNRYFVQDAYYKPGGPVICEFGIDGFLGYIVYEHLLPVQTAKKFNGLLILWEHRFYGNSYPRSNVSDNIYYATPQELTSYYQYLTMEQALEDVPYFANSFSYKGQSLTPATTPWVYIGVSYSANRGAWLAKRNPGLFKATLASSAPVQQQMDFWQYFRAVEEALAIDHKNCLLDLHAAASWMSTSYETRNSTLIDWMLHSLYGKEWDDLAKKYSSDADADILWQWRRDYMEYVTWASYGDFQYVGVKYGKLDHVCKAIETAYSPEGTPEGVFATETLERAVAAYVKGIFASVNVAQDADSGDTNTLASAIDNYSWLWQFCTEVGGFQVANMARPYNLIPSFMNVQHQLQVCINQFGVSEHMTWAGPNVGWYNQKYLGWDIELPNVFWTNGEFDPWRSLSIESPEAPKKPSTNIIPKCGDTFPAGTQLRYIIKGGHHGSDFAEPLPDEVTTTNITATTATKTVGSTATRDPKSVAVVDANNAQRLWLSAMDIHIYAWSGCNTGTTKPREASAGEGHDRHNFDTNCNRAGEICCFNFCFV